MTEDAEVRYGDGPMTRNMTERLAFIFGLGNGQ